MKIIVDTHCDTVVWATRGQSIRENDGHLDLKRMQGQVDLQFFALFVESRYKPRSALERTLELVDIISLQLEQSKDMVFPVTTKKDLKGLGKGKIGALISLEGGEGIHNLSILRNMFRLGVRCVGLTWNERNQLADGSGVDNGGGLTSLGKEVIKEMNQLGMVVDAAHMSAASFWDTLRVSQSPLIVSHANCRSLYDHPRNLSDMQLKALAAAEGICCLTFAPQFLHADTAAFHHFLDHLVHAAELMGTEHIGIGSDYDGIDSLPDGIGGVEHYSMIIDGLVERGFNDREIAAISGANVLSLLEKILPR